MMTKDEAIAFYKEGKWKALTHEERAALQLKEDRLCMPLTVYHEAITVALGRDVWTHEFAYPEKLIAEFNGDAAKPSFDEILALIPADKLMVVVK